MSPTANLQQSNYAAYSSQPQLSTLNQSIIQNSCPPKSNILNPTTIPYLPFLPSISSTPCLTFTSSYTIRLLPKQGILPNNTPPNASGSHTQTQRKIPPPSNMQNKLSNFTGPIPQVDLDQHLSSPYNPTFSFNTHHIPYHSTLSNTDIPILKLPNLNTSMS